MKKSAVMSSCGLYRYELWRVWDERPYALFICLNPSTADAVDDDPTIRRCIGFAQRWGYGGLCMANLFALRATDPRDMKSAPHPIGEHNDWHLKTLADDAGIIIAGWGTHGKHLGRDEHVKLRIPNMHYLKLTVEGHPSHPLYLPKILNPQEWKR